MNKEMTLRQMKFMGYGLSAGFIVIDLFMLFFFRYYGVTPMAVYSIFSIAFYFVTMLFMKADKYRLYTISVYLEVVAHMTLAVICIGTGKGFEIALIGMNLVAFYSEYLSEKYDMRYISGIRLACVGLLAFLGSYAYDYFYFPAYELPEVVCFWLQIVWGAVVFAINIFFLKILVTIALTSERQLSEANTKANNMVTALSADYGSVYYADLDENRGVCYRKDPKDKMAAQEEEEFPFCEYFSRYCRECVNERYQEGFLNFIDPQNIREKLAKNAIISYRYLAERDGQEFYEMIRMAGVRKLEERDDGIVHAIGLGFTDIDEEMRETMARNEALSEALLLAEESSKAKTSFLSSMSHEIRTPMNAIIGLDTLALKDESMNGQTREYLEKIGSSARHLLSLINDILDMSRIESGRIVLRKESFSFSDMLEQINTMVMSQCSDKGITYECRVLNHVDDHYVGDVMKLKEILINILSNAIKFTDAPGAVALSIERTACFEDQSSIRFRIRDTGIGMDKEFIPMIFNAFSQEDGKRTNKYGSTGLGMAITKNLVEMMNGTIDVVSEKGVGTEFVVTITLRNTEQELDDHEKSLDTGMMHALVADADEVSAAHAGMVLEEAGIRTDICSGMDEVMQITESRQGGDDPYNLLILDRDLEDAAAMPEMLAGLRARCGRETATIMLTAYTWDDISEEEASQAGADSLITKPLFAANVIREFEQAARRNGMDVFSDKKQADLSGRNILLAEDVEINAEIMKAILEMSEMGSDRAENGKIAVEMFETSDPGTYDAILMDVRMPVMDGLEAASTIRRLDRADAKQIPIIALTANAFDEDVQRSLQAGMNAHLAKPVEPDQLLRTLGELIFEAENKS